MSEQPTFLTREGQKKLEEELHHLQTVRRAEVAERLHAAMEEGDIDENAEYDDAKNEQAFVEGRILTLENILKNAVIIDDKQAHHEEVSLGAIVTIVEGSNSPEEYHVVGFGRLIHTVASFSLMIWSSAGQTNCPLRSPLRSEPVWA